MSLQLDTAQAKVLDLGCGEGTAPCLKLGKQRKSNVLAKTPSKLEVGTLCTAQCLHCPAISMEARIAKHFPNAQVFGPPGCISVGASVKAQQRQPE